MTWLFLDIDGVLNHQEWYEATWEAKKKQEIKYPVSEFDPQCVARVNRILEETGAQLVVSSTWRIAKDLPHIFKKVGLPTEFYITPRFWTKTRGEEIQAFLEEHEKDPMYLGKNYAILDDDNDFDNWQKTYCLFRTAASPIDEPYKRNGGTGLTDKLTEQVIKHLKKYGDSK